MAHIYMHFDFGADEEKAQEARHKLDVWKQTFRLDKKLQYKLDRPEEADEEEDSASGATAAGEKHAEKPKSKSKSKLGKKTRRAESDSEDNGSGNVSLLVRLYFSSHEKLSEQRWLDRIPTQEPFKSASPKVLRQGEAGFEEALKQFSELD
ncbi:MAG TPA: hypothetical protein VLA42_04055 [Verrucomicrobiae bacterium]|jgi:hypothetical protein|nr:hypothetical protein [Verrucomicrobiae bacterium]